MRKLPIDQLSALFQAIAEKEALYIPADDSSGQARFQRWHEGMEMTHALNTVRSAKDFFFPQTENLVDFKLKGKEIEAKIKAGELVVEFDPIAPDWNRIAAE